MDGPTRPDGSADPPLPIHPRVRCRLSSYRIEKIRCAVVVVMMGGEELAGEIFLNPASRFRSAPQDPGEFLNEDDPFLALAVTDGRTALVAKTRVESVTAGHADCMDADGGASPQPVPVAITLASGSVLRGTITIDAPPSRARLLDYLNTNHERFLRIADGDRVILVNRQAIDHVHEQT